MNSGANSLATNFSVTRVKIWENEMLWGHEPQCFYRFFSHEYFYNSIETRRTCFPFLLENTTTNNVNLDYPNVSYSCLCHNYVNSLC